jgi:hypothetical protein
MPPTITDLDTQGFRAIKKKFFHSNLENRSKERTPDYYPAIDQQLLSTPSCSYQWLMKKEVDVYDGALVSCRVEPPNPALVIPTTTCQEVTPSAA